MTVQADNFNNIARAISVYADAARADKALLTSTALVGADARITDAGENYTGVLRWLSYTDGAQAGKPSSTADAGTLTAFMTVANQAETYIKNVDVVAAKENSVQTLISKVDGLSYLGGQFGAVRARREDAQVRSVIKGIVSTVYGTTTDTTSGTAAAANVLGTTGAGRFGYRTAYDGTDFTPLFELENTANNRSSFFDVLLDAMTAVSGEFEEPFYYLGVSAETFNTLRKQNVLDVNPITDGNIAFNTLLGGKIRLIVSGNDDAGLGLTPATGLQSGLKVSVLMKASSIAYSNVTVNNPTAVYNQPLTNEGFGDVTILSRWGNIMHPRGYSWAGAMNAFPTNTVLEASASWTSVAANVNQTGIFPIFHG